MNKKLKAFIFGLLASVMLLTLYFVIMFISQASFSEAYTQLSSLALWVIPLVFTFGLQVGLYIYVKDYSKRHMVDGKTTTISSVTSGTAMIACCAHHLTDTLPIIGFSIFATFLSKYQTVFLGIGILSNLTGIGILFYQLKKMKIT